MWLPYWLSMKHSRLRACWLASGLFGSTSHSWLPPPSPPVDHRWLACPLQSHSPTSVPLAVPAPMTSTHSPDWTPVMLPSPLSLNCWLAPPLQFQITSRVPAAVWLSNASRQRVPPRVRSSPAPVNSHCWLAPPLQSQMTTAVPGASLAPVTSRQRPEAVPTSGAGAAEAVPRPNHRLAATADAATRQVKSRRRHRRLRARTPTVDIDDRMMISRRDGLPAARGTRSVRASPPMN